MGRRRGKWHDLMFSLVLAAASQHRYHIPSCHVPTTYAHDSRFTMDAAPEAPRRTGGRRPLTAGGAGGWLRIAAPSVAASQGAGCPGRLRVARRLVSNGGRICRVFNSTWDAVPGAGTNEHGAKGPVGGFCRLGVVTACMSSVLRAIYDGTWVHVALQTGGRAM